VFASVGATRFDVTWTTRAGDKEWFRRGMSLATSTRTLPSMLNSAPSKQRNVIVRPHGPAVTFIQLDDLKAANLARLAPAVFLALENLPRQFPGMAGDGRRGGQGLCPSCAEGHRRRPDRERRNARGWEPHFKDKYAPDFRAWRSARRTEGDGRAPPSLKQLAWSRSRRPRHHRASPLPDYDQAPVNRKWPSYARCVDGAPLNHDETGPDISKADFVCA